MKRIEAIIRPHKQAYVLAALAQLGITNVTVIEILGLCDPPNHSVIFDPEGVDPKTGTGLIPKKMLLLFVADEQVQPVLELIQSIAVTGRPGDGVIAVSPLDQVLRVRPKVKP
jgi:nitrogen regulatory protein P-II 1